MNKYLIVTLVALLCVYSSLFFMSSSGWGYVSYSKYYGHRTYSFWYFGRPDYYMGKSVRTGSVRGGGSGGGGIHGGK